MADPFIAEIRVFPFNFVPKGWARCDGQSLPLSQHVSLFSVIGTYYGGNGKSDFWLPDLQGRIPVQQGQGAGLTMYDLGAAGGTAAVTLVESEMPAHSHPAAASQDPATTADPQNHVLARSAGGPAYDNPPPTTALSPVSVAPAGGSMPHNNLQPYLALYYCIALQGIFPTKP